MPRGRVVSRSGDEVEVETEDGERVRLSAASLRSIARGTEDGPPERKAPGDVKFFQYELEAGVVTVNELRASKGLSPDGRFGEMTLPEYVAANAATYKAAALARSTGGGLAAGEETE